MNRAAARRRGKRKEAERKAQNAANALASSQQRMWTKLNKPTIRWPEPTAYYDPTSLNEDFYFSYTLHGPDGIATNAFGNKDD